MFSLSLLGLYFLCALSIPTSYAFHLPPLRRVSGSKCSPFWTTFPASAVANAGSGSNSRAPFVGITPPTSYKATGNGLQMFLDRPKWEVTTANGVNDFVGEGSTLNSTFTMLYGRVTWVLSTDAVPGVITAAIFIADKFLGDEIDLEFLGSDPTHWQTNVFAPAPEDTTPLYGVLSSIEDIPQSRNDRRGTITEPHAYTIDWNADRIIWSIDGQPVRQLTPGKALAVIIYALRYSKDLLPGIVEQTGINGALHYPKDPMRIQLGIWDASTPIGTAEWAGGPINWQKVTKRITATIHSITVEC
ncbi:hypothetical protein HGRIS_004906 [Hohenbuehelia grisea]|uniref:GH16 domain-containing protein n=1 Tax=Hohenbuehelia grisea TaxID=104357 RepID=A0ABR3JDE2_9AGAR